MKFRQIIFSSIFWRSLYFVTVLLHNIIVSRYFQAAGSGWIYYIINNLSFILLIASLNLETGMIFYASKKMIPESRLALFSFVWSIVVAVLIAAVLFFMQQQPEQALTKNQFVFFTLTYTAGILLTTFFSSLFYAQKNFFLPNIILTATNLLLVTAAAADIYAGKGKYIMGSFLQLYFLNFLVQGVLLFIAYSIKNKTFASLALPAMADVRKLFRYSMVALVTNIVFFLLYRIDYWFIKNICVTCHEDALGNYIQVAKLGQLFLLLPTFIASAIFPHTAAGFGKEVNSWLPVLVKSIFFVDLAVISVLVVTGQWLFPWVFGKTFTSMYLPFVLLIPGILALSAISILAAYNAGKDMVKTNMKGALVGLLIIVAGDWLFIPQYGIRAAAAISSIGYTGYFFYLLYVFKKEYNTPVKLFFIPGLADLKKLQQILSGKEALK